MLSINGMIECKARNEPPIKFERPGHDVNDYSLQDEIREFLSIKTRPILATAVFAYFLPRQKVGAPPARGGPKSTCTAKEFS